MNTLALVLASAGKVSEYPPFWGRKQLLMQLNKKSISWYAAFLLVAGLIPPVSSQNVRFQNEDKSGGVPMCRLHFTRSWEDYGAALGTMPTTEFSRQLGVVFADVGTRMEPEPFVPWTRAIEQVMRGSDHGLSVALATPERAKTLEFLGPIFRSKWYAYKKQGHPVTNMDNPKVGVFNTYAELAPVQKAVSEINGEIIGMPLQRLGRMLEEGRVDLIYGPVIGIGYLQNQMHQTLEQVPGIEFELLSYVAIRKDAPCMSRKDALNEALVAWSETDVAQAYSTASPLSKTFADIMGQREGQAK